MMAVQRCSLPDPPFTHRNLIRYSGKYRPGMDHMGTEMLVQIDRLSQSIAVPVDAIRW